MTGPPEISKSKGTENMFLIMFYRPGKNEIGDSREEVLGLELALCGQVQFINAQNGGVEIYSNGIIFTRIGSAVFLHLHYRERGGKYCMEINHLLRW